MVAETAVDHVGVGEVFVIAGQSNSANSGEQPQRTTSHLVSSFGGDDWRPADDPQPGVNDGSNGGSPWPAFGDALAAKYKVPVGIASTGRGGTSVHDWRPDGDLFKWMTKRMEALGPHGFRAVLWHQGEADYATPANDYAGGMTEIIRASQKAAGWDVPWFVAQVLVPESRCGGVGVHARRAEEAVGDEGRQGGAGHRRPGRRQPRPGRQGDSLQRQGAPGPRQALGRQGCAPPSTRPWRSEARAAVTNSSNRHLLLSVLSRVCGPWEYPRHRAADKKE